MLKTLISLIFLIFIPAIIFASERDLEKVEDALVWQEWNKVGEILKSVDTKTDSPVLRLIKGHADLAVNKNNESLCLFLSVISEEELKQWDKWTENFLKRHPESAVAYYLRGDALARLEKWDAALEAFNKALEIEPENALVFNARGVVYAAKGELDKARLDFYKATKKTNVPLADAYCNLGFLNIQKKDGAEGAIRHFTKALEISPDFALALHGRGIIKVILFQIEKAEIDSEKAKKYGICANELFRENFLNFAAYIRGIDKRKLVAMLPKEEREKIGMSLKSTLNPLKSESPGFKRFEQSLKNFERFGGKPFLGQWSFNKIGKSIFYAAPEEREELYKKVDDFLARNPDLVRHFYEGAKDFRHNPLRKFEYNISGKIGKIGGEVKIPSSTTDQAYTEIGKRLQDIAAKYLKNQSGVLVSFTETTWDQGEWPFDPYYGLLYGLKSKEFLLTSGVEGEKNESSKQK